MPRLRTCGALALLFALAFPGAPAEAKKKDPFADWPRITLEAGPSLLADLKNALLTVQPGTVIELPAVTLDVDEELSLATSHVVLRGTSPKKTVLRFAGQTTGAQGMLITGDYVTLESFAVEDTPGDGIRAEGVRGITFRKLRIEWTGGPSADNGAYGVYPVLSQDVLVENCEVVAASDAGIYVGQSSNIVVRFNKVHESVAGIEIENSFDADVFKNQLKGNTGGVLVFNLPGLTIFGARTRVFQNKIVSNNTPNFGSGYVGMVPAGTGVIVLANDQVEVFQNKISGNITSGVSVISFALVDDVPIGFDPFPETVWIHDNRYRKNGADPQQLLGQVVAYFFGGAGPDVFWDEDVDEAKLVGGELPDDLKLCIQEPKSMRFGSLDLLTAIGDPSVVPSTDVSPHDCSHAPLGEVVLPQPPPPPAAVVTAACQGGRETAFAADCPRLSDYNLFEGNDPRAPTGGGVPYDLTTPLFSDYARKYRVAYLPDGTSASYDPNRAFDFPVGTILAKTFAFAADLRDPGGGEDVVETRLLIRRAGGWVGRPYLWRTNGREADLALAGGSKEVAWIHFDGTERSTHYSIPNANQCVRCHREGGPIGPTARLLNRDFDYDGGTENQLAHWTDAGLLAGAPDPGLAPRVPVWDDPSDGTLEDRAKGYLDINCAHCHNPEGAALNTALYLDWGRPTGFNYGVCKKPVAAGSAATGGFTHDIEPGSPEESILVYRMASTEAQAAMPELARSVVHEEGLALVAEWIATLPGSCPLGR